MLTIHHIGDENHPIEILSILGNIVKVESPECTLAIILLYQLIIHEDLVMKKIQRIKDLNELMRHPEGYTIMDLMYKLGVSERTIRKDLEQIQRPPYNVVFWNEYRGKERLYRYKDIHFSITLFDDTNEIKNKLVDAIEAVSQYSNTPQFEWLKICLLAIESEGIDGIGNVMSFENNADLEGLGHIQELTDAIVHKYPIKLTYKPYRAEENIIYVHPYHLKQYNNRWFLIGKPENKNVLHNYAIDRIVAVEHLSKKYVDTDVDFEDYFDDIVGVSVNDCPIEDIEIMVSKRRYPYIKTKPLHWTQKHLKEKDNEDEVCLSIRLKPNREFVSMILSYGPDIRVLSPANVKKMIVEKVINSYLIYHE